MTTLLESSLNGLPVKRGKVRDVYDLGDRLLIVATDRISAFDWVLPTGIPDKGRILNTLSAFWFSRVDVPHHVITTDVDRDRRSRPGWADEVAARRTGHVGEEGEGRAV